MTFTPRSLAWWYGFEPTNAGKNEWWMLMMRPGQRATNAGDRICM